MVEKLVSLCDNVFEEVERKVDDKVEGDVEVEVKVSLCDDVFDEVEGKGEDHCGVLFCADAVQGLGEVGGQDCDDRGEEYGTMAMQWL